MASSSPGGPASATTLANFAVDTRPTVQVKEDIEIDLCRYFAQAILRPDGSVNFTFGTDTLTDALRTLGVIPLIPGRLTPEEATCGMIAVSEKDAEPHSRGLLADVNVTFRGKEDRTAEDTDPSGQEIAYAAATALEEYLHRSIEGDLTNVLLPSGRRILAFNKIKKESVGEDDEKRYFVNVSFEINLSGDDIL